MELNRLSLLLWSSKERDNGHFEPYASADLRTGIDRVETVEGDSGEGGFKLPPGNVIESVRFADGAAVVYGAPYTPDPASVEAMGKVPLLEGLKKAIVVRQNEDRWYVSLLWDVNEPDNGNNLVLVNCGHQLAAEQNRDEIIRMLSLALQRCV